MKQSLTALEIFTKVWQRVLFTSPLHWNMHCYMNIRFNIHDSVNQNTLIEYNALVSHKLWSITRSFHAIQLDKM